MVQLFDVNEQNWLEIAALSVREDQKHFLDCALGIVARGYAYRACNAKVIGIAKDGQTIGVALVKDMDEAPACYDLQQFMIDARFQNRGYGSEALRQILARLSQEGKYADVEVCVHKEDAAALRMYENAGFVDTGYVDGDVPHCRNLMYHFSVENGVNSVNPSDALFSDTQISDFFHPLFQEAFQQYFAELGVHVKDWDGLFAEMDGEEDNLAFIRTASDGQMMGFILIKPIKFTSCFFEETCGFVREFWVAEKFWHCGHGAALLHMAEKYFCKNGIFTSILTTDTAAHFYEKRGYEKAHGCKAKNGDDVFIKRFNS